MVRQRVNIVDVISHYLSLKKAGKNYRALCPFHQEKTPSFMVNEEKQIFHCFGCGAGGDVFTFLMRYENLTFYDALTQLAQRVGVTIPKGGDRTGEETKRDLLFQINETVADFFHTNLLTKKAGSAARAYLAKRGIRQETLEQYRLGYAPAGWTNLVIHLRAKSVDLKLAQSLGLIIPRKQQGWYDQFRNRIIFPILDTSGHVVGFGGRAIDDAMPKYLNSSESLIYQKSRSIYGIHMARDAIRHQDLALVVEGYFDLLMLHQSGFKNAVAPLGTAVTRDQVTIMKRYTRNFVLLFDPDEAGIQATFRALDPFMEEEIHPKTVRLPDGHDPDSFVKEEGASALARSVEGAVPLIEGFIEYTVARGNLETTEGKVKIARSIVPMLRKLRDPLERRLYARTLSERLGVKEGDLVSIVEGRRGPRRKGDQETGGKKARAPFPTSEEALVEIMLNHCHVIPTVFETGVVDEFEDVKLREMAWLLREFFEQRGHIPIGELLGQVSPEDLKSRVSFWALSSRFKDEAVQKTVADCVRKVKITRLKRDRDALLQKIREVEKSNQKERLEELLRENQDLVEREKNLRGTQAL
jgi:DNA primase